MLQSTASQSTLQGGPFQKYNDNRRHSIIWEYANFYDVIDRELENRPYYKSIKENLLSKTIESNNERVNTDLEYWKKYGDSPLTNRFIELRKKATVDTTLYRMNNNGIKIHDVLKWKILYETGEELTVEEYAIRLREKGYPIIEIVELIEEKRFPIDPIVTKLLERNYITQSVISKKKVANLTSVNIIELVLKNGLSISNILRQFISEETRASIVIEEILKSREIQDDVIKKLQREGFSSYEIIKRLVATDQINQSYISKLVLNHFVKKLEESGVVIEDYFEFFNIKNIQYLTYQHLDWMYAHALTPSKFMELIKEGFLSEAKILYELDILDRTSYVYETLNQKIIHRDDLFTKYRLLNPSIIGIHPSINLISIQVRFEIFNRRYEKNFQPGLYQVWYTDLQENSYAPSKEHNPNLLKGYEPLSVLNFIEALPNKHFIKKGDKFWTSDIYSYRKQLPLVTVLLIEKKINEKTKYVYPIELRGPNDETNPDSTLITGAFPLSLSKILNSKEETQFIMAPIHDNASNDVFSFFLKGHPQLTSLRATMNRHNTYWRPYPRMLIGYNRYKIRPFSVSEPPFEGQEPESRSGIRGDELRPTAYDQDLEIYFGPSIEINKDTWLGVGYLVFRFETYSEERKYARENNRPSMIDEFSEYVKDTLISYDLAEKFIGVTSLTKSAGNTSFLALRDCVIYGLPFFYIIQYSSGKPNIYLSNPFLPIDIAYKHVQQGDGDSEDGFVFSDVCPTSISINPSNKNEVIVGFTIGAFYSVFMNFGIYDIYRSCATEYSKITSDNALNLELRILLIQKSDSPLRIGSKVSYQVHQALSRHKVFVRERGRGLSFVTPNTGKKICTLSHSWRDIQTVLIDNEKTEEFDCTLCKKEREKHFYSKSIGFKLTDYQQGELNKLMGTLFMDHLQNIQRAFIMLANPITKRLANSNNDKLKIIEEKINNLNTNTLGFIRGIKDDRKEALPNLLFASRKMKQFNYFTAQPTMSKTKSSRNLKREESSTEFRANLVKDVSQEDVVLSNILIDQSEAYIDYVLDYISEVQYDAVDSCSFFRKVYEDFKKQSPENLESSRGVSPYYIYIDHRKNFGHIRIETYDLLKKKFSAFFESMLVCFAKVNSIFNSTDIDYLETKLDALKALINDNEYEHWEENFYTGSHWDVAKDFFSDLAKYL